MTVTVVLLITGLLVFYKHYRQVSLTQALQTDIPITQRTQILATAQTELPKGGAIEILSTKEGIQLRTIKWYPKEPIKGTFLLCQGYSEFIEKYDEPIQQLLDRGFAVLTFDWRGQGLSSRLLTNSQKGHITNFEEFMEDADLVYEHILRTMPAPYFLMAHSMGGHLAFRVLQEQPRRFQKAILCAPFFGWSPNFGAGKLPSNLVILIGTIMKWIGYGQDYTLGATPPAEVKTLKGQTSDKLRFQKRVAFYKVAPHILMGGPTWDWILAATKSLQLILQPARIAAIQTPILLVSGAKDGMVDPQAHLMVAAQSAQITLHSFPEAMHEILMEQDSIQEEFWLSFDRFVLKG